MTATRKIRVLVADGSVVERERMVALLRSDPEIEMAGEITRGAAIVDYVKQHRPDVVVLGINLPPAGGVEATREVMIDAPTPVVIVSNESDGQEVNASILALRAGALAVVARPPRFNDAGSESAIQRFMSTVKGMAQVKVVRRWREQSRAPSAPLAPKPGQPLQIVAIAASTGGPAALQRVLSELPVDFQTPILVVQHIAGGFVDGLVGWLNALCSLKVKLATPGEPLLPHVAYVAPDDHHLGVDGRSRILLSRADPIGGFRPSATFLFESVSRAFGSSSLHVILTGMGQDGVAGLRAARRAGARIIAQDEASSVVFGMPGAAIAAGVVDSVVPLAAVTQEILAMTYGRG